MKRRESMLKITIEKTDGPTTHKENPELYDVETYHFIVRFAIRSINDKNDKVEDFAYEIILCTEYHFHPIWGWIESLPVRESDARNGCDRYQTSVLVEKFGAEIFDSTNTWYRNPYLLRVLKMMSELIDNKQDKCTAFYDEEDNSKPTRLIIL